MPKLVYPSDKNPSLTKKLQSLHIPFKIVKETHLFPEGLRPLVNEITNGQFTLNLELANQTLPLSAYSGINPVLTRLGQQKRLIVNTPRNQLKSCLISLLKEIPPSLQVRIIVPDLNAAIELKDNLLNQGVNSYYIDKWVNSSRIDSNIRIAPRSKVGCGVFSLQSADLVIFSDSFMLVDSASRGIISKSNSKHNLSELFDPTFPTSIPSTANVLGFLGDKLPLNSNRHLWTLFSIDTLSLNGDGSVIPTIYYRLVEFKHTNPPVFSSKHPTNFEVLKKCIWKNAERDDFIKSVIQNPANDPKIHQKPIVISNHNMFPINDLNSKSFVYLESGDVSNKINLFYFKHFKEVFIRSDAGIGMLDDFKPKATCLLIDIVDIGLPNLDRSAEYRIKAYKRAGFVKEGNGLFLSRWKGI